MNKTFTSLFAQLAKYSVITTLVVTGVAATAAIASSQSIKAPKSAKMEPLKVQIKINSPKNKLCPQAAQMQGWVITSMAGPLTYKIANKNGDVTGSFKTNAVRTMQGGMAKIVQDIAINETIDTQYRVLIKGENNRVASNWMQLKKTCKLISN